MWPPKHIARVGVELEGGWDEPPDKNMHGDVSVQIHAPYVGEVSSSPLEPALALEWMVQPEIYPDYGNATCGIHVHLSTKDYNEFAILTDKDLETAFIKGMTKWGKEHAVPSIHPFWSRLNGENRYCKKEFIPEAQMGRGVALPRDARRTQLNFAAFKKYGTLECRMLPYFADPNMAASAIRAFLEIVDDFIEINQDKLNKEFSFSHTPAWHEAECVRNKRKIIKCAQVAA